MTAYITLYATDWLIIVIIALVVAVIFMGTEIRDLRHALAQNYEDGYADGQIDALHGMIDGQEFQ